MKSLIITGVTGMVGEGVLLQALQNPSIDRVLVINRKPCGREHPKLKEIIHADFFDISPIENELKGYDGCLFCLGVSSIGMKEPEFTRLTYTLTMNFATTLSKVNPSMVFCYISGAHTDSTEKGKRMWARVKGKTENDLAKLQFKKTYAFRPGMLKPTKGQKNILSGYKFLGWLYYPIRWMGGATTLKELGEAMINAVVTGYEKNILEVEDIKACAKG